MGPQNGGHYRQVVAVFEVIVSSGLNISVRRGGQEGVPPLAGQNIMFLTFLKENSIFQGIF